MIFQVVTNLTIHSPPNVYLLTRLLTPEGAQIPLRRQRTTQRKRTVHGEEF